MQVAMYLLAAIGGAWLLHKAHHRVLLSLAKHRSLGGHARLAQRFAKLVPFYEFRGDGFFAADDAPADTPAEETVAVEAAEGHEG